MSLGRWSLGVLIFEMCHGYPPFRADNQATLFEDILLGRKRYKVSLAKFKRIIVGSEIFNSVQQIATFADFSFQLTALYVGRKK